MTILRITRRGVVAALASAVAWPLVAREEVMPGRIAHIAYLGATSPTSLDPRQIEQFKQGLADNGLVEGRNITVDYLWADGSSERLVQLADELAKRNL
jgi:putative tryptophan/tyrosine transport system substrate-binding protein